MKKKSTTLIEVAAKAGVSRMTASRALANEGYVSEEARNKVLAAARELNYEPSRLARMMKGAQTHVIGIIVNSMNGPIAAPFITALTEEARKVGMEVLTYNLLGFMDEQAHSRYKRLASGSWDGLIYVLPRMDDDYQKVLEASDLPIVLINYFRRETSLPVVRGDNFNGSRDAVASLVALGHQRIGFVGGIPLSGQSGERERGYRQALADAGLAIDESLVVQGEFSEESGRKAARILLSGERRPTAIFCANDSTAIGCMAVAKEMGLELPSELSLIGFDDSPVCQYVEPTLTTLRHPTWPMAQAAVQELMRRIRKEPGQRQLMEFPSELVVRDSIAAPAKARGTRKK